MENNEEIRINKIPLEILLQALKDMYERGVDFVDLIGKPGDEQDSVGIVVRQEYFSPGILDEEDEIESKDISDEDLNQLI